MFNKILIANRGEIALRVIYACRELNIPTVAVYSVADEHALHVRFADEAVCIGPERPLDSYLSVPAIITASQVTDSDAIHPGYGFLSEASSLADAAAACGITFIGPPPEVLRLLGDKSHARRAMERAGLPVLPGTPEPPLTLPAALTAAQKLAYPLIVKAAAGGGGRGMRVVHDAAGLEQAWGTAEREAAAAFGDGTLYLEQFLEAPRHIEFQVLADDHGHVVHLGERECSIQHRHQKLLEESPSVAISDPRRRALGEMAVIAARAVGYRNAGTFEFLVDDEEEFFFLEVNTRLQVEHPVTEMVTGVDIVKEQIRIAAGESLSFGQEDVVMNGHAIECRINAESPETLRPSPGRIRVFNMPGGPGIRVDTAACADGTIPPWYDSLVAKLVAHGRDRAEAIARMRRALDMTVIEGIDTTVPVHRRILDDPDFIEGRLDTTFMERFIDS